MPGSDTFIVMLIAPISTREVTLGDLMLLPDEELRVCWNHADQDWRLGARAKGETLLADLPRYAAALSLDILGKAVRHVFQKHGRLDQLILVASDQPETVEERFRRNDTVALAKVVRELLRGDARLKPIGDSAKIMLVRDNPSDYEVMRAFYRQNLGRWCSKLAANGLCYLAVSGGTPQMGAMLLFEGARRLRERAAPLYVLPNYDMPVSLDVGRQVLADELVETLQRDLSVYAYHAAWKSAVENAALLREVLHHYDALVALLECGRRRLNFDFATAQAALFGADRGLPPRLRTRVLALAHELSPADRTAAWLIAEVYHSAAIRYRTEAYASFVERIFRFQEALTRHLCETWDAQFGGKNNVFLDEGWLASRPGVAAALAAVPIDVAKPTTRATLQVVARQLALEAGNATGQDWLRRLDRFEQVANLRNQLVHGFEGVSEARLAELYRGGGQQILADMASLLTEALATQPSDNPYDRINALCGELLGKE